VFYSKNKFEKLVHLVGFIRICHDARSPERQITYILKYIFGLQKAQIGFKQSRDKCIQQNQEYSESINFWCTLYTLPPAPSMVLVCTNQCDNVPLVMGAAICDYEQTTEVFPQLYLLHALKASPTSRARSMENSMHKAIRI